MRWRRPSMAGADRRDRARRVDLMVSAALGLPVRDVRPITTVLRTEVTGSACRLLPGIEHSTAPGWLDAATIALTARPVPRFGHAAAAALPAMMLYVVTEELLGRYAEAHPTVPIAEHVDAGPPAPSDRLRAALALCRDGVRETDQGAEATAVGRQIAGTLQQAMADPADREWGGWGLLAVVVALHGYQSQRPEQQADAAYRFGRLVMTATAVELLD